MGGGQISGAYRLRTGGPGSHARCSAFLKKKTHFPKLPTGQPQCPTFMVCPQRPLAAQSGRSVDRCRRLSAKTGSDRLSFNYRYRVGEYDDRLRPYGRGRLNWFRLINLGKNCSPKWNSPPAVEQTTSISTPTSCILLSALFLFVSRRLFAAMSCKRNEVRRSDVRRCWSGCGAVSIRYLLPRGVLS